MLPNEEMRTKGNELLHETMKQLVTISSGAILVMIALLESLFVTPRWKFLIAIALFGFLVTIIASVVMMWAISLNVGAAYTRNMQPVERPARRLAMVSFILAMLALVIFVIKNLFWS